MNNIIKNFNIDGYRCSLYLPDGYMTGNKRYPVIYVNGGDNINEIIKAIEPYFDSKCRRFILLNVEPKSWNDDYTPWPAQALTSKSRPFCGFAGKYIHLLENNIKPFIDDHYRTQKEPENTALIGYSLGGLAALYALYKSKSFGMIGSMSGSLWYDGWINFMDSNIPENIYTRVYLSLGKKEEKSRNMRMAKVGDCMLNAYDVLKRKLASDENVKLEWNDGGHFTDIPHRFVKSILWLMKSVDSDIM